MENNAIQLINNLRFDHLFYVQSYLDLQDLSDKESESHFAQYGIQEGRFCSAYHFFNAYGAPFAGCISIQKYKEENSIKESTSPLQVCEMILQDLSLGIASKYDQQYFPSPTKRPTIAKHGKIWHWASQFNQPNTRVLEIGSRCVSSDSKWKSFLPNANYTGIDILNGKNVDIVGDAHDLSKYFELESFDLVISLAVFEHLAMPWLVAEEIAKILKVGGYFAIETHFSFSEHELPWHFFQFNSTALTSLFNKGLGFEVIDHGLDSPMIGRFAEGSAPHLRGKAVPNLYCHSSIIGKKIQNFNSKNFCWKQALPSVINQTMYPSNTGLSKNWKQASS